MATYIFRKWKAFWCRKIRLPAWNVETLLWVYIWLLSLRYVKIST